jgi:hypothetical protein
MFKLATAECLPLTHELVDKLYNMEPSPTERSLDPSRLKYLKQRAEAGQLVTFQWACARLSGRTIRMNGQHSSTMLKELNGSFPKGLMVHLDTYDADDMADLAVLFRQFDARKSSRSTSDIAGAYQGLHPDLKDVQRPIAKLAVEGIAFHEKNVVGTRTVLGDDQYSLFEDKRYHPFIRWMGDLHNIKTPEMKLVPVAAAMYATFITNEAEARTFWDHVARGGVEFDDSAPATVLDAWLKQIKSREEKTRLKLHPANYYQGCIYAWNGHREGKALKDIRFKVDKGLLDLVH